MGDDYNTIHAFIESLNLNKNESYDVLFEADQMDKRMQSIRALLNTESVYLNKIVTLLTDVFRYLDRKLSTPLRKTVVNKDQVVYLFYYFPKIYNLHQKLNAKLKEVMQSTQLIGKVFLEFLSQNEVLTVYETYVERISKNLEIGRIIETNAKDKYPYLRCLDHIIMSPIQKFPQLKMALYDVYKYTADDHIDKINLFKANSITKSITLRLDRCRQNDENENFKIIFRLLTRLRLPISSNQLLSKHSVVNLRRDLYDTDCVIKTPYELILCNQNIVMIPKNLHLSSEVVFCYSLLEIDFENPMEKMWNDLLKGSKVVLDAKNARVCLEDFNDVKVLYRSIGQSNEGDRVITEYGKLLTDFCNLLNINENFQRLSYNYGDVHQKSLDRSLLDLGKLLKEKEKELNVVMNSIIMLKGKGKELVGGNKLILFDSSEQANEWRIRTNKTKLRSENVQIDWLYYPAEKNDLQIKINDLPLFFQPFPVKTKCNIKCQLVCIVVGIKVVRGLWICSADGVVSILHFDYQQWAVLESFKMDLQEPVTVSCGFLETDRVSKQILFSEIWMATGCDILIHYLTNGENSKLKGRLKHKAPIKSICNIDNKMLVALSSNIILIYSKSRELMWFCESEISLSRFQNTKEDIKEVLCGNELVYAIYDTNIIICERNENGLLVANNFTTDKKIQSSCVTDESVWISFSGENTIYLYDKRLQNVIQTITIPSQFSEFPVVTSITSIYVDKKYIWLGTDNGHIIAISTVDSSYCTDSSMPMYFSSTFVCGAINQLIPFQNIQSLHLKNQTEDSVHLGKEMVDCTDRSSVDSDLASFSCHYIIDQLEDLSQDETDALTVSSLRHVYKGWKNSTMTLILAIGSGTDDNIFKPLHCNEKLRRETAVSDESIIFTFLE